MLYGPIQAGNVVQQWTEVRFESEMSLLQTALSALDLQMKLATPTALRCRATVRNMVTPVKEATQNELSSGMLAVSSCRSSGKAGQDRRGMLTPRIDILLLGGNQDGEMVRPLF